MSGAPERYAPSYCLRFNLVFMKTIGMIGGLGPESTIDYYRLLISAYRSRVKDDSYPSILINSLDVNKGLRWLSDNDLASLADYLVVEIQRLRDAGAHFGLISANTPHIVFDEVQTRSSLPLISIVEVACAAVKSRGMRKVGLLGTKFTMQAAFYPAVFSREGIALVTPTADEQAYIHEKYVGELLLGKFLPETRERLLGIMQRMKEQEQIESVVLAGTELPLILRQESASGIPLLDTTKLHVEAAIERLLAG